MGGGLGFEVLGFLEIGVLGFRVLGFKGLGGFRVLLDLPRNPPQKKSEWYLKLSQLPKSFMKGSLHQQQKGDISCLKMPPSSSCSLWIRTSKNFF